MRIDLSNTGRKPIAITPTAAVPIFGRSADNLRDHRHVTSLLHRIDLLSQGVLVQPTMSFDERGHHPNTTVYGVVGCEGDGTSPIGSFPTVASFIGEGGSFDAPKAVFEDWDPPELSEVQLQGRESVGALRFRSRKLSPGKTLTYLVFLGISTDRKGPLGWIKATAPAKRRKRRSIIRLNSGRTNWIPFKCKRMIPISAAGCVGLNSSRSSAKFSDAPFCRTLIMGAAAAAGEIFGRIAWGCCCSAEATSERFF